MHISMGSMVRVVSPQVFVSAVSTLSLPRRADASGAWSSSFGAFGVYRLYSCEIKRTAQRTENYKKKRKEKMKAQKKKILRGL